MKEHVDKNMRGHEDFVDLLKQEVRTEAYCHVKATLNQASHPTHAMLAEYAAGELSEITAMHVMQHLAWCHECTIEVAGFMRNHQGENNSPVSPADEYGEIKQGLLAEIASEYWEPEYAGLQATAADIPQQEHTFSLTEGDIQLTCNWGGPQGSDPAFIWLKWRANIEEERELYARFVDPETQTMRYEARLGTYLEGEETFSSRELGFDPSRERWAVSIVLKEAK